MKQQTTTISLTSSAGNTMGLLITSFFKQFDLILGSAKQTYKPTQNKVVVQIPYFGKAVKELEDKKRALALAISKSIRNNPTTRKRTMEVELQFISLRYPYLDSSILAQYLALNAGKYNFLRLKKKVFASTQCGSPSNQKKDVLPRSITGVKMELAGRLTTQQSIPRKTVSNAHKGSFGTYVANKGQHSSMDYHMYSSKNKLGAYTMKV